MRDCLIHEAMPPGPNHPLKAPPLRAWGLSFQHMKFGRHSQIIAGDLRFFDNLFFRTLRGYYHCIPLSFIPLYPNECVIDWFCCLLVNVKTLTMLSTTLDLSQAGSFIVWLSLLFRPWGVHVLGSSEWILSGLPGCLHSTSLPSNLYNMISVCMPCSVSPSRFLVVEEVEVVISQVWFPIWLA